MDSDLASSRNQVSLESKLGDNSIASTLSVVVTEIDGTIKKEKILVDASSRMLGTHHFLNG